MSECAVTIGDLARELLAFVAITAFVIAVCKWASAASTIIEFWRSVS
ncbi:hypothetical protein EDC90_101753 [Martelella mediterranea]|uniref:Uncharacterized protein n=1 Tax=Martelella mediterranea TaxID=293089 RepID=A0A4R3NP19_9HYPH|nr:hypothetical protein EDC90_101840 [Martelella mediterranea]TCT37663.1 hypothetical protein EDC90_101753 [Martelella mediterranea]